MADTPPFWVKKSKAWLEEQRRGGVAGNPRILFLGLPQQYGDPGYWVYEDGHAETRWGLMKADSPSTKLMIQEGKWIPWSDPRLPEVYVEVGEVVR